MVSWEECRIEFVRDGGLRDIVISNTTLDDWEAAYKFVLCKTGVSYHYDNEVRPAPDSVRQVFASGEGHRSMLSLSLSGVLIHIYFFVRDEIEAVFNPGDVNSQATLDVLLDFVRGLGDAVGRPASVSPSGLRDCLMFTYDPASGAMTYHAPRFGEAFLERPS